MNLADVMDDVAARIDTIPGLRVSAFPPDQVQVPAAVVTYPEAYTFDETYGRGMDRLTLPVVVMVGKVSDRKSRDQLAAYMDGSGPQSLKAAIEATSRVGPDVDKLVKHTFSADGTNVSTLEVVAGPYLQATLSAGTTEGFSNLRDVYVHEDLTAADFHAEATFDPPFFGDRGDGVFILPQHALVLRYQRDTMQRAVVIWNNIVFGLPTLLIGVWQASLDGLSGFANRQAAGFPAPFGLAFPYTVEARLRDTVVNVRQRGINDPVPEWDDPVLAREIDLETDAGDAEAIPTPIGEGQAGIAAAHLGIDTDPLSAVRYPLKHLYWEQDTAFDTVRVQSAEFDIVSMAGVEYVAATLTLDIAGPGSP
ncbi:MAG TPA: hypothetical protein VK611_21595 [Acidimicrobiales bacterium]|nr:hypothetical protein [Acidimicrobiales bacterium]